MPSKGSRTLGQSLSQLVHNLCWDSAAGRQLGLGRVCVHDLDRGSDRERVAVRRLVATRLADLRSSWQPTEVGACKRWCWN